jgi:hypothetical protein
MSTGRVDGRHAVRHNHDSPVRLRCKPHTDYNELMEGLWEVQRWVASTLKQPGLAMDRRHWRSLETVISEGFAHCMCRRSSMHTF